MAPCWKHKSTNSFSLEEGTSAGELNDNVPEEVKEERASELMAVQQEIAFEKNAAFVGSLLKVVIDEETDDYYIGRTAFDSPEVDQIVYIHKNGADCQTGNFYTIEITSNDDFELYGEVAK